MRKIIGVIAILFGSVGLLASLIGCVLVWPTSVRLFGQAEELLSRADETVVSVQEQIDPVDDRLRQTRNGIAGLRTEVELITTGDQLDSITQDKLNGLVESLDQQLHRIEEIGQRLKGAAVNLRNLAHTMAAFARDPDEADRLREVVKRLDLVIAETRSALEMVTQIRQTRDVSQAASRILVVLNMLEAPLIALSDRITEINGSLTQTREQIVSVDQVINRWRWLAPTIVTIVLIWMGLGQWCLLGRGLRQIRSGSITDRVK